MSACPTPPAPLCTTFFGGGGSYGRAELERLRARGVI